MFDRELDSGWNLPPGCFEDDIDSAFGGERHSCAECMHCIESGILDCCVCELDLADALAKLAVQQRWSPQGILTAVEDATTNEGYTCAKFEE